jgi:hypothetical protein
MTDPVHLTYKARPLIVAASLLFAAPVYWAQSRNIRPAPRWQEAREPAAKGTQIPTPGKIKELLKTELEECVKLDPSEINQPIFDTYRIQLNAKGDVGLVVWGRGACLCSPTGNCSFWIFLRKNGKYEMLLDTEMVRDFGFLTTKTRGIRDLVVWSHSSAFLSPAFLYHFDGELYNFACGWEEHYELNDSDGNQKTLKGPQITEDTCISVSKPK